MIKVAVSGIHGSGKTTLIKKMKDYLETLNKTVFIVEEVARKCSLPLGTIESQRLIWENQINKEYKAHQLECNVILCDRTLLDNLIYYKYLLECNNQIDPVFEAFTDYTFKWMNTYDYISVLDMNPEFIIDDGVRIIDINKTIEINKLFTKYLKPYQNIDINRFNYKKVIMAIIND